MMNAYSTRTMAMSVIIVRMYFVWLLEWKDRKWLVQESKRRKEGVRQAEDNTVRLMVHHLFFDEWWRTDPPCNSPLSRVVCLPAWCVCGAVARLKIETIARERCNAWMIGTIAETEIAQNGLQKDCGGITFCGIDGRFFETDWGKK